MIKLYADLDFQRNLSEKAGKSRSGYSRKRSFAPIEEYDAETIGLQTMEKFLTMACIIREDRMLY